MEFVNSPFLKNALLGFVLGHPHNLLNKKSTSVVQTFIMSVLYPPPAASSMRTRATYQATPIIPLGEL